MKNKMKLAIIWRHRFLFEISIDLNDDDNMIFVRISLNISFDENEICNALEICKTNEFNCMYQLIHSTARTFSN